MPTVIYNLYGFRFFFHSNEETRIHIHVEHGDFHIKVWMDTFEVAESNMPKRLEGKVIQLVRQNEKRIIRKWKDYFKV